MHKAAVKILVKLLPIIIWKAGYMDNDLLALGKKETKKNACWLLLATFSKLIKARVELEIGLATLQANIKVHRERADILSFIEFKKSISSRP